MNHLKNYQDFKGGRSTALKIDLKTIKTETYTIGFKGWLVADTYHGGRSEEINLTVKLNQ